MSEYPYEFYLASSLEKVFPSVRPAALPENTRLSAWRGTRAAVQLVYRVEKTIPTVTRQVFRVEISGAPCETTIRRVELLPSDFPVTTFPEGEGGLPDDNYITTEPGMFPDLLQPAEGRIIPLPGQYRSLWLSWQIPADARPGAYPVTIRVCAGEDPKAFNCIPASASGGKHPVRTLSLTLCVGRAVLEPQRLIHTEWFHADCLGYWRICPRSKLASGIFVFLTACFSRVTMTLSM